MASTRVGFTAIFPAPGTWNSSRRLYAARRDFRKCDGPRRRPSREVEAGVCNYRANRVFQSARASGSRDHRIENSKSPADSRTSAVSLRRDRQEEGRSRRAASTSSASASATRTCPRLPTSCARSGRRRRGPANHRYPDYEGLPTFRAAAADWYRARASACALDPATEVVSLIGSKEGIANMAVAFVDPGDIVLVPDPGYPVYAHRHELQRRHRLPHAAPARERLPSRPRGDPRGGRASAPS